MSLFLVLLFDSSLAAAQDASPPRLLGPPAPVWPSGEPAREVEVVLLIDVDATGAVVAVEVERRGSPRIDEAAVTAARALRFEPARAAGAPIASRVRLPIRVVPPPPPPPPAVLRGRVVDARTKAPVAGARVEAVGRARSVMTDATGAFSLELGAENAGAVEVRVEAAGHRSLGATEMLASGEEVEVRYALMPQTAGDEYETIVTAPEREEVSRRTLVREEVRQTPGTMGDPFRVIETLPGVTPLITGLPYYYIRGAPPADTGYFFDGVRVPALFHLAFGPSVIHPYLVDKVDFWAGGAPARFPGSVGGVVSAETAALPRDKPHLDIDVRLVDAGAIVAVPFGGGTTRASVSGRYSYTAALLSAVSPGAVLDYWDYQALVEHDLSPRRTVSLFAFGSYDLAGEEVGGRVQTDFSQEFHRLVGRYEWKLGGGGELDLGIAGGYERTNLGEGFSVEEWTLGPRARWKVPVADEATAYVGGEGTWGHSILGLSGTGQEEVGDLLRDPDLFDAGVYGELDVRPAPKLTLLPGLRLSTLYYVRDALFAIDPRFGWRYALADDVTLEGSVGLYHQKPAFIIPLPGLDSADLDRGWQRSVQTSQGVEWTIPEIVGVDAQVFYHRYENLSDLDFLSDEDLPPRMEGNAYGLEVIVRRPAGERFFGWIAYTLSQSERAFATRTGPTNCPSDEYREDEAIPGQTAPADFDRTHVVNVVASYVVGWNVRAGARLQYRSGHPYTLTRCFYQRDDPETPQYDPNEQFAIVYGERNGLRTPDYLQLDLRVDRTWRFDAWSFELYLEVINVTGAADTIAQIQPPLRDGTQGPPSQDFAIPIVIPTLGVRGVF